MPNLKAAALHGTLTAILTPFDSAGQLTLENMPALLDFQRQAGIDGVVVCGTNGEGTSLSVEERERTLERVLANRGGLQIIAGTGAANLTDTLALTRHAAEAGADAVLVLPPFFYKDPPTAGLEAFFRAVLDAADIPVLLYSIPQMSAIAISDELLDALLPHPNLAGVKDSAGNWERTSQLITKYPTLRIFPGSDYLAGQGHAAGAAGVISGGANAFPEIVAAVQAAHRADPTGRQREEAQNRLSKMTEIVRRYPLIAVSKSVLAQRGLPRLSVRPPLINLTLEQETRLLTELKDAGML